MKMTAAKASIESGTISGKRRLIVESGVESRTVAGDYSAWAGSGEDIALLASAWGQPKRDRSF